MVENSPDLLQMMLKQQHMLVEQQKLLNELIRKVDFLQPRVISSIPAELKIAIKKDYTNTLTSDNFFLGLSLEALTSDNFFLGLSLEEDNLICMNLARKY